VTSYHNSSTSYVSHYPPQSESDYLVMFKCMRIWQRYTEDCKRKRHEHRVMVEHMATAINYHQQSLRTKTILSFIKYRVMLERERRQVYQCQTLVRQNMLKWYFQAIIRKYSENKWFESGKQIAMLFKVKVTLRKVLHAWFDTIRTEKSKLLYMRTALGKDLRSTDTLLNFIGRFYLQKSYYNRLDIDELRIFAYN
jgi:hypothetical protein